MVLDADLREIEVPYLERLPERAATRILAENGDLDACHCFPVADRFGARGAGSGEAVAGTRGDSLGCHYT